MAKPNRLPEVEQAHGQPLETLIPDLLAVFGTQKAVADHLGVSQATISTWLRDNGFVPVVTYVKKEGNEHAAPKSA